MNKYLLCLSLFLLCLTIRLPAQTKRALIIGLGEQEDKCWAKINGDKDIPYIEDILNCSGYRDIKSLINSQATKKNIEASFRQLASECEAGDIICIHFSGHGQQITDVDGDEPDGWDEAWIPYDACLEYDEHKYRGENHLTDDELNILLTLICDKIGNTGKILVVVDACHSGDSSRGDDIDETVRGVKQEFVIPVERRGTAPRKPEPWLTLSACKDYQINQEMKTPHVGKLSYALYSLFEEGNVTMEGIVAFMHRNRGRYVQTPQLTGEISTYAISDFF